MVIRELSGETWGGHVKVPITGSTSGLYSGKNEAIENGGAGGYGLVQGASKDLLN